MSTAPVPVSFEEAVSRFAFRRSHGGAAHEPSMELPAIVPASRLVDRPAPATVLTGIEQLDALTGGLPRGALTEICGPASSGRTSVLLALLAQMTSTPTLANPARVGHPGEVCALVDAGDCFHPKSAEAAGVELRKLLWIRCSKSKSTVPSTALGAGFDRGSKASSELRVVSCERNTRASAAVHRGSTSGQWSVAGGQPRSQITNRKSQMDCLEQALKATDLLLQGGGFGLVVVDLGDVPAQAARRVPLTSWFRFRRAVENTPTVLVVVEQEPYAKTCASVVLKLSAVGSRRSTASGQWPVASEQKEDEPAHARILSGLRISAEILRSATQRKKPAQPAHPQWESKTAWAG